MKDLILHVVASFPDWLAWLVVIELAAWVLWSYIAHAELKSLRVSSKELVNRTYELKHRICALKTRKDHAEDEINGFSSVEFRD